MLPNLSSTCNKVTPEMNLKRRHNQYEGAYLWAMRMFIMRQLGQPTTQQDVRQSFLLSFSRCDRTFHRQVAWLVRHEFIQARPTNDSNSYHNFRTLERLRFTDFRNLHDAAVSDLLRSLHVKS